MSQSIETFGGLYCASLPYFNTVLSFDKPVGCIEEEDLVNVIDKGGSLWVNNGVTVLSEVVTNYKLIIWVTLIYHLSISICRHISVIRDI